MRKNEINDLFKSQSLTLKSDAMKYVESILNTLAAVDDGEEFVQKILQTMTEKALQTAIVTKEIIQEAVSEIERKQEIELSNEKMKKKIMKMNSTVTTPNKEQEEDAELPIEVEEEEEEEDDDDDDDDGARLNRERLRNELADEAIVICDAFKTPRYQYDETRKAFVHVTSEPTIDAMADSKINVYRERFHVLRQRVARNKMFTPPAFARFKASNNGSDGDKSYQELTPLRSLVGNCYGTKYVMGCLSQIEDGIFHLEDSTGSVRIDLTSASTTSGLFCENCVVVAEGEVRKSDGIFEVRALAHPPVESRKTTLEATNATDFMGASQGGKHVALRPRDLTEKEKIEKESVDASFVVISDCHLDDSKCLRRLQKIFEHYDASATPPGLFVFMGDFTRVPFGPMKYDFASYTKSFDQLADLLDDYPSIREECRFVFIPGPGDPGNTSAYPRPGLSAALRGHKITACLQKVEFASNPAKIRWHSQDLVFFRDDLQARARRACLLPPVDDLGTEEDDQNLNFDMSEVEIERRRAMREKPLFHHLAMTLVQQSHLAPLPLTQMPIYWERDQAMWLYPAPNTIFLGDRSETQCLAKNVCEVTTMVNPGCFADDGSFVIYKPSSRDVILSAID